MLFVCNIVEQLTERDKFMSPLEAKEFGIVDHVLTRAVTQDTDNN